MSVDWGEVYRTTFQELVRYLHRKVWDEERARDLAQEVFVRALRRDHVDQPRAFLFKIATNLARDESRTVLRRKRHLVLLKNEAATTKKSGPEEELMERERWSQVRKALDSLTDRDREVLLLWDSGLSYREIAEVAELSPGAVGTTLARARRRLVEAHGEMEESHAARN